MMTPQTLFVQMQVKTAVESPESEAAQAAQAAAVGRHRVD